MPPKKRTAEQDPAVRRKRGKKRKSASNGDFSDEEAAGSDNEKAPEPEEVYDESRPKIKLPGSETSGCLLVCGGTNWDLIGRNNVPKGMKNVGGRNLWGPHRIKSMTGIRVRTVISGCTACHSIAIADDGKAYSWGRNDKGQLGHGDTLRKDVPTLIESLQSLVLIDGACGKNHTLLLSETGDVYAFGDNKMGQLGLGNQSQSVPSPTRIHYRGPPVRKVACGAEFSIISDVRGNMYSFGSPEFGQLGHNSDGKYFVSSNKLSYSCETKPRRIAVLIDKQRDGRVSAINDAEIIDLACGANHAVALDTKKRVFTWGFGGYGRLGHSEPKDEMVPRMVKSFEGPTRGAIKIFAGTSFGMGVSELGALYFWGQTKATGEASMYPKLVQDLSGWQIRSVGCSNKSIVLSADESVISWGPSPTYGELGYGDTKARSSTTPQEVKCLHGAYIHSVACGYGHTLMIARDDSDEDKAKIEKLPEFVP